MLHSVQVLQVVRMLRHRLRNRPTEACSIKHIPVQCFIKGVLISEGAMLYGSPLRNILLLFLILPVNETRFHRGQLKLNRLGSQFGVNPP